MPKVYFLDTGLRNFAIDLFKNFEERQDRGALLENFIFSEIIKYTDNQIRFWRTKDKAEIDFILIKRSGAIYPIEIKAAHFNSPEIPRSFRGFIEKYQPKKAFIVNLGFQGKTILRKTNIIFIHPYEIKKILQGLKKD